jgi:hypothetical protein
LNHLPPHEQDPIFRRIALALAIDLNAAGPKKATLPLCKELLEYFYGCADSITLRPGLAVLAKALPTGRIRQEATTLRLKRKVCRLALQEHPDLECLKRAIQEERQAWETSLLGKHHSPAAMVIVRAALQAGLGLQEASRPFRSGQLKIRNGGLVVPRIQPALIGVAAGLLAFVFPGLITYNMHVLQPENLTFALPMLLGSICFSGWYGWQVYAGAKDEKNLFARLESLFSKRVSLP